MKGANFRDWFQKKDVKDEWLQSIKEDDEELHSFLESVKVFGNKKNYNYCYLCYMAIRIIELHRVLKDTGSFYLHCDHTMSHYLKLLLDIIFGEKNFRNEIVWCYGAGHPPKKDFAKKHDIIFRYSKNNQYLFNTNDKALRTKFKDTAIKMHFTNIDDKGRKYRIYPSGKISYEEEGKVIPDYWIDIDSQKSNSPLSKEYTGYPTQKPLALLDRMIKASSNKGNMVLDAFCGCCTTMIASEKLDRKWIGIDVSVKAYELVKKRLKKEITEGDNAIFDWDKNIYYTQTEPIRTDTNGDSILEKKFVYIISNKAYKNQYKVGIAKDCKSRLNSYQIASPSRDYKLEFSLLTENFRQIEKYIHCKFDNEHEWVKGNLQDIIQKIKEFNLDEYNKMINQEQQELE